MIQDTIIELKKELPSDVTLVAVSKFHPFQAIVEAYNAGQRIFAESRPQELLSKQRELEAHNDMPGLKWHFIGHLQTNKLKMVLPYVSLVESVDSVHLLDAIEKWGEANDKTTNVLLEYHISSDVTKQGFSKAEIMSIFTDAPNRYHHIRFRGLMGMATHTTDEAVIRADFRKITTLAGQIKAITNISDIIDVNNFELSFGMSGDWRIAVECGSTMVRIGTLIFGNRVY